MKHSTAPATIMSWKPPISCFSSLMYLDEVLQYFIAGRRWRVPRSDFGRSELVAAVALQFAPRLGVFETIPTAICYKKRFDSRKTAYCKFVCRTAPSSVIEKL